MEFEKNERKGCRREKIEKLKNERKMQLAWPVYSDLQVVMVAYEIYSGRVVEVLSFTRDHST